MTEAEILICEDERVFALDLERRIQAMGHVVRGIASNTQEAVELSRATKPALALMDIRLKGGDSGIDAAQVLRKELGIPSIFLTAYGDEETVERASATGPVGYLLKPVQDHELQIAIELGLKLHSQSERVAQELKQYEKFFQQGATGGHLPFHDDIMTFLDRQAKGELTRDLVGSMAHHLNNRWAAVRGMLDYMESFNTLFPYERRRLREALREVDRCADLLQKLLWSSGQGCLNLKVEPVGEVIRETLDEMKEALPSGIEVSASITDEPIPALIDRAAFRETIRALVFNAAEAMDGSGIVEIGCTQQFVELAEKNNPRSSPGWYVDVHVKDTGKGIDKALLDAVVLPFFTTKVTTNAVGLGLSIAQGVATALGGWLEIQSERGEGTTVHLFIPKSRSERRELDRDRGGKAPGGDGDMRVNRSNGAGVGRSGRSTREWGYL